MTFQMPVNRATPVLPPGAMQSYEIFAPITTHWRKATCAEVGCLYYLLGWRTIVDVDTVLGANQANYIRLHSGRRFIAEENGSLVTFHFASGQKCFADHGERLDRPEIYVKRPGDWRATTGERHVFRGRHAADDWVDDFANHQNRVADAIERG